MRQHVPGRECGLHRNQLLPHAPLRRAPAARVANGVEEIRQELQHLEGKSTAPLAIHPTANQSDCPLFHSMHAILVAVNKHDALRDVMHSRSP